MIIDYIYLILILILIGSILLCLYLSYEYRNSNSNSDVERFVDLEMNKLINNTNSDSTIRGYLQNQINHIQKVNDSQVLNDNKSYQNLNKNLLSNINDSNFILTQKHMLTPPIDTFPIDKLIKTIKSNYNAQYVRLFANDINKYGVVVNDKCFTVNGLCKTDEYCLQKCQNTLYTSDSQKFSTDRINSADDISRLMKVPKENINSANIYPFNIFRSKVNDRCLSINNDGIFLEDCNLNSIKQQWIISPDENICVLN